MTKHFYKNFRISFLTTTFLQQELKKNNLYQSCLLTKKNVKVCHKQLFQCYKNYY